MNFSLMVLQGSILKLILLVGIFTMMFSSLLALVEEDMKKVVALSTLSQMGFSAVTLGLGLSFVRFLHLVSHAFFKSCLFMQVGYIIHNSFGQQDGRGYVNNGGLPYFIQLQLLLTLFCLCGLVFSSGSVSKDIILELFFSNSYSVVFSLIFFLSVFFTFGYRYRLWKRFFLSKNFGVSGFDQGYLMVFLSSGVVLFSLFFLWWINNNVLTISSIFLYVDFFVPLFFLFMIIIVFWFV